ncbi:hypothetical protein SAMN05443639_108196 [Stigmatella erecta]|uniref:Uncharacterized protein n=1 Tax=Stigmatella erecta TaxID=83460 RepID=A0A1I0JYK6_9BACT|nr:hypothetical protein SAMN05443639_108196 [Stigmatella erecta]
MIDKLGSRPQPKVEKQDSPRPLPQPTSKPQTADKPQLSKNVALASHQGASSFEVRSFKEGPTPSPGPTPTPTPSATPTLPPTASSTPAPTQAGGPPVPTPQPGPTPTPPPPPSPEEQAASQVSSAQASLDTAREGVKEADEVLKGQLARLGPALTDAQKQEYIKAYHEEHKDVYEAEAQAATELRTALEDPALAQNTEALKEGYTALAESSEAQAALDWASRSYTQPGSPLHQDAALAEIAGKAAATASTDIIAQAGTPQEGVALLREKLAPFMEGKEVAGSIQELKEAFDIAEEAANGNYDRLASLAEDWSGQSDLMKSIAVIGVAAGVASATNAFREGNYAEAIGALAETGQNGLELLAGVTKSLAQSGKLVEMLGSHAAKAERLAGLASRFAPALGAAAASASLYQHATEDDKNAGTWLAMGGDLLSIAGSVLEATPLAPVGGIINAAGTVLTAVGDLVSGIINRGERQQEEKDLMAAANEALARQGLPTIPQDVIDAVSSQDSRADRLQALGLTPEQVQQVIHDYPDVISYGGYFESLTDTARAADVSPENFNRFLDALSEEFGDTPNAMSVLNEVQNSHKLQGSTPSEVDQAMREYIEAVMPEVADFR